jgi:hypothetical protein
MRPTRITPVDCVEQISKLRSRDRNGAIGRARPDEPAVFQAFRIERHADAVVPENLDRVPSAPAKDEKVAGVRIAAEAL